MFYPSGLDEFGTNLSSPEFIERMASSLLAAMGITKPANSSFQPETFNASNATPETMNNEMLQQTSNSGPSAQPPPPPPPIPPPSQRQQHREQEKQYHEPEFDFDNVLREKEDMEKETTLQNRYVFYWLKRGKGAVSKIIWM